MKKNIFLIFLFLGMFLYASTPTMEEARAKLKAPIENIFNSTQWSLFLKEFEIYYQPKFCGKGLDLAIGFKAHMIEPIGYFETTKNKFWFPFAKIQLGNPDPQEAGNSRPGSSAEGGRQSLMYAHFIYFPIMGMIFKNKMPAFCFSGGSLDLPFISEFFPFWKRDTEFKNLVPQMLLMFTPQGLTAGLFDCVSTEASASLRGYLSGDTVIDVNNTTGKAYIKNANIQDQNSLMNRGISYLNFVRDSLYFNVGCLNFSTIGGYVSGEDPISDSELLMYTVINLLHGASSVMPVPMLYKQTEFSIAQSTQTNKGVTPVDTWCAPAPFPMAIESQYVPQRVYPTVGRGHEWGQSPVTTTNFANVPGSHDDTVFLVWERRDYVMFAYKCPGWGKGTK